MSSARQRTAGTNDDNVATRYRLSAYDAVKRLKTLASPAGAFGYGFDAVRQGQVALLSLPNGAFITNTYDAVARLTGTYLENSSGGIIDGYTYVHDLGGERTNLTRSVVGAVSSLALTYDPIGQLKTALGAEADATPRFHERFGYGYDAAGNLNNRTNNDLVQSFGVNSLNELTAMSRNTNMTVAGTTTSAATNVTVNAHAASIYADHTFARTNFGLVDGNNTITAIAADGYGRRDTNSSVANLPPSISFAYDANGNLRTNGTRIFDYDDENQLIRLTEPTAWKSEFAYDGRMRRRNRKEFSWSSGSWVQTNEVRYIYDGNLVLQERDTNNAPLVTYTRASDLSGTLQGAGGIGGLLARIEPAARTAGTAFYHCDASGNITCLINTNQLVVAKYLYEPYGGILAISGPVADANLPRFASKEQDRLSGVLYFGRRFYDPSLRRWLSQDPLGQRGGINLHQFAANDPIGRIDRWGLNPSPEDVALLQRELAETSENIKLQRNLIESLQATVKLAEEYANAAEAPETKSMCAKGYNLAKAALADAEDELSQLQAQYNQTLKLLAAAAGSVAGAAATVATTAVSVYTAPTVAASFTGYGLTGAAIASGSVAIAAGGGALIGYGASQIPVVGGGNVADFWGDVLYSSCPSCFK